jgi:hypothetical protein
MTVQVRIPMQTKISFGMMMRRMTTLSGREGAR